MDLISVDSLPTVDVAVETTRTAAAEMRTHAESVLQAGDDLRAVWNGLREVYDAPETLTLTARMADVTEASADFARTFRRISGTLGDLAEALAQAEARLRALRLEVDQLRRSVLAYRAGAAAELLEGAWGATVWGPGQYEWNASLLSERERVRRLIEQAHDDADRDLRAIGSATGLVVAGFAPPLNPLARSWQSRHDEFVSSLGTNVLERLLAIGSPRRMEQLLARHPEWVDLLHAHPPSPDVIARWWEGIGIDGADALAAGAAVIVGSLGGVPATLRVQANQRLADARLTAAQKEFDLLKRDGPFGPDPRVRVSDDTDRIIDRHLRRLAALQREMDYLGRVESGDVKLYLYRPGHGEIIEMFGDPETAQSIITSMPGTNTTMESFYTSGKIHGVSALTRWQVERARETASVAGFVVKQGPFPRPDFHLISTGPQNNDMAESLGASYARFAGELHVVAPETPIISVEHSFGSAVGGVAETLGAKFHSRLLLAGIGMTAEYAPDPKTKKYSMQASNDTNKSFYGAQLGNWGYAVAPTRANSIVPLESGLPGTPEWVALVSPISPPIAIAADFASGLEQHNRIISADEVENGTVLNEIADQLSTATAGGRP